MPKILQNVREQLLAEAKKQVAEKGYASTTVRSVAAACGLATGTVYNYFPSKDEIVIACVAAAWMQRIETIRTVAQYSRTYESVIHCIYDQIRLFGEEYAYIFKDETAAKSVDGAIFRYMWFLSEQLAQLLRKFCKSDAEAQIIAEALLTWIRPLREDVPISPKSNANP